MTATTEANVATLNSFEIYERGLVPRRMGEGSRQDHFVTTDKMDTHYRSKDVEWVVPFPFEAELKTTTRQYEFTTRDGYIYTLWPAAITDILAGMLNKSVAVSEDGWLKARFISKEKGGKYKLSLFKG